MRKVTLVFSQLLMFKQAIDEFEELAKNEKLKLNGNVSWMLHKNKVSIYDAYRRFIEYKHKLIEEYAKRDDNGKILAVRNDEGVDEVQFENEQRYMDRMNDYMSKEIEVAFHYDKGVERKLNDFNAEHTLLNNMWDLLNIFKNYGT